MSMSGDLSEIFPAGLAGLIFDCDGVMIDSAAANRFFYNTVLASLGLPPMTKAQEDFAFMATARGALQKMTPEHMHPLLENAIQNNVNYARDVLPRIKLMPGFLEFIGKAHGLGLRMAIDTNRTKEGIDRVLDFFDLPNYFDPVVSATCAEPKPTPDGVNKISAAWNVEPDRILFIGDSIDDRSAAMAGGARFAAFGARIEGDVPAPDFPTLGESLWRFCRSRGHEKP